MTYLAISPLNLLTKQVNNRKWQLTIFLSQHTERSAASVVCIQDSFFLLFQNTTFHILGLRGGGTIVFRISTFISVQTLFSFSFGIKLRVKFCLHLRVKSHLILGKILKIKKHHSSTWLDRNWYICEFYKKM